MGEIAILGAGLAGLGAAHRFRAEGLEPVIYEKCPYPGGHTASFAHGDFVFDDGPHVSFTKDERFRKLLEESVEGRYEVIQARVNNHWRGYWLKHPAQCNLHPLPNDLVVDVIRDFVEAAQREGGEVRHYADWLITSFGRTFAETFPMQYGRKYHTTSAENMTVDWLGPRLYRPSLDEVLRGALSPATPEVHYVDRFRYPTRGGFAGFLRGFLDAARLELGHDVTSVDPTARLLSFSNGREVAYEDLVSSLPLPELVARVVGAPPEVTAAARRLACTTCVLVNLGVDRADLSQAQWSYFYDDDFVFTRLSFPHMLSPHTAPPGAGSIQAEIYYSAKYRPLESSPESHIEPVIRDLERCGLLREGDQILHRNAAVVPYANVIFDLERPAALATVLAYLGEIGITTAGRYGRWGYHWTDESFLSGEEAAQGVLDRLG